MKNVLLVFGVLVLLVAAVGCKKEEPVAPTETTESSMQNTMEEAGETVTEAGQAMEEEGVTMTEAGQAMEEEGQAMVDEAAEAGQAMTEETAETVDSEMAVK